MMQNLGEGGVPALRGWIGLDGQKTVLLADDDRGGGGLRCVIGGITLPVSVLRGTYELFTVLCATKGFRRGVAVERSAVASPFHPFAVGKSVRNNQ